MNEIPRWMNPLDTNNDQEKASNLQNPQNMVPFCFCLSFVFRSTPCFSVFDFCTSLEQKRGARFACPKRSLTIVYCGVWIILSKARRNQNHLCAQSARISPIIIFAVGSTQNLFVRTAKTPIRLGGCPGWSESPLRAHVISLVSSWCDSLSSLSIFMLQSLLFSTFVVVCSGLTSLSTIFQSSRRCLVATGSSMLTFIVLPWHDTTPSHTILTLGRPVLALPRKSEYQAKSS